MLRTDSISLHVPEPLALIDATLLFTVQVLVAESGLLPDGNGGSRLCEQPRSV